MVLCPSNSSVFWATKKTLKDGIFSDVFEKQGVPITMKEARLPMGLRKDLHIKKITEIPEVSRRWKEKHGRRPTEEDLVKMYNEFIPIQLSCLEEYSTLIPGALETITKLIIILVGT